MIRYKYNPINLKRTEIIKNLTLKYYGYKLTDDYYNKLCNSKSRSNYFDKLLCIMTSDYFMSNNNINNKDNLHRWNLSNREKTKYEKNYPW